MGIEESESEMSGGAVAYHLRENKAIERNLFIELLARIGRVSNISDYTYIGFGGPFLEDFKALHAALRIHKMISVEMDLFVHKRQVFNSPAAFIELRNCQIEKFLVEHQFFGSNIVWLDYTAPKELYQQLTNFRSLIGKLGLNDVAKITLNANPAALGEKPKDYTSLHEYRKKRFKELLSDFCSFDLNDEDVLPKNYPAALCKAVSACVSNLASRSSGEYFQPLSSFVYKDGGHQMLTITGIILDAKNDVHKKAFLNQSRLDRWPFCNLSWGSPTSISVPSLSAKERLKLDEALPLSATSDLGNALVDHLGYCPSELSTHEETKLQLANYAKFYRSYPLFSRVVL